jgi:hypothetical protein
MIVVEVGAMVKVATGPAVTVRVTVAVFPVSRAVTVWTPTMLAVQLYWLQEPSGLMLRLVGPGYAGWFPYWSNSRTVY